MKTTPPEPLYTFRVTNLGYSIATIPATAADRTKFLTNARRRGMSCATFVRIRSSTPWYLPSFET